MSSTPTPMITTPATTSNTPETRWMRLYGAVATEAFGHLNFALSDGDAEALFEGLLGELADRLGLAHWHRDDELGGTTGVAYAGRVPPAGL